MTARMPSHFISNAQSFGSSADSSKTSQSQVDEAAAKDASEAQITIAPKNGATNASINNAAIVTVAKGKLTEVTMTTAEGDAVEVDTPLVTLESEKATMEIPAPVAGVVDKLLVKLGDTVSEGTPIATIFPLNPSAAFYPTGTLLGGTTTAGGQIANLYFPGTTIVANGGINVLDLPGGAGCESMPDGLPYDEQLWNAPGSLLKTLEVTGIRHLFVLDGADAQGERAQDGPPPVPSG